MSRADERLEELAETFDLLGDWEERYRYVIDLGRDLPPLAEAERNDRTKVSGCASQVWVVSELQPDGTLAWRGESDAHIVRGLVAIMLGLHQGLTPDEVLAFDARGAVRRLGLAEALSAQRSNGLNAMIERIRRDAAAYASR